jgi:uncharacterized protein (DUF362 family)
VFVEPCQKSRRRFLVNSLAGGIAAAAGLRALRAATPNRGGMGGMGAAGGGGRGGRQWPGEPVAANTRPPVAPPAKVALTTSDTRMDQTFKALKLLEKEITEAIGNKPIIIKPNLVDPSILASTTHVDTATAVLEFLKSIKKTDNVAIAESPANGSASSAYQRLGFSPLAAKYGVKLLDIDQEKYDYVQALNERDMRPRTVRVSKLLLDNNYFVISLAMLKTHTRVVATFSLKNIVLGSGLKNANGQGSDKPHLHGGGYWGINFNLFNLAPRLHPNLAIIDGFQGMEGNGPANGTAVNHKVCVASLDWLAADTVGATLMGFDPQKIGYLNFSAGAQLGQSDVSKMEVLGEEVSKHIITYKTTNSIEEQYSWKDGPYRG